MVGFVSGLDPNIATLLSGAMSMIGGAIGAAGAYWVATYQTKRQFLKQDDDRILELHIEKLYEALTTSYDYFGKLQSDKNVIDIVKKKIDNSMDNTLRSDSELKKSMIEGVLHGIQEYDSYINKLEKYKIFIPNQIDLKVLKKDTSCLVQSYRSFLHKLDGFVTSITVHSIVNNPDLMINCEDAYKELAPKLQGVIDILENEIKKLLKLK